MSASEAKAAIFGYRCDVAEGPEAEAEIHRVHAKGSAARMKFTWGLAPGQQKSPAKMPGFP
jgi:hypothetical protein